MKFTWLIDALLYYLDFLKVLFKISMFQEHTTLQQTTDRTELFFCFCFFNVPLRLRHSNAYQRQFSI